MKYLWLLLLAVTAFGQNIRYDNVAFGPKGPIPNATIAVCSQPATTSTQPCTPLVSLCSSLTDTACSLLNPFFADALGNFHFYVSLGSTPVTIQIYGPSVAIPLILSDQLTGLSGTVLTPMLSVTPTTLAFGTVKTNTASPSQSITILNNGNASVTINSVVLTGSTDFSSASLTACNGVLASGASCSLSFTFTPTAAVAETATVTVNASGISTPPTVSLTGTGSGTTSFPLNVTFSGAGTGVVVSGENPPLIDCTSSGGTCSNNYASGASVTLTATPSNGSAFGGFTGDGCSASPCTLSVTAATTVNAAFAPPGVALTVTGAGQGSGTVVSDLASLSGQQIDCNLVAGVASSAGGAGCSASFSSGSTVTLSATAQSGSSFVGWSGGPSTCTTSATCAVPLSVATTVTANFAATGIPLALVQTTSACSTATANNVACTWGSAQSAGDFIICRGHWSDITSTVSSLTDSKGNTYTQAPTISPKTNVDLTQVLYYAQNIVAATAGSNVTTLALSANAAGRGMECAEYAGVITTLNPIDVSAAAVGTTAAPASGAVTTTVGGDLITGWTVADANISAPSSGFVQQILSNAGGGGNTFSNVNSGSNYACSGTSCVVTLSKATAAGHAIVGVVKISDGTTTISSVSGGGTYTVCCYIFSSSAGKSASTFYTMASTSGATSITVTLTAAPTFAWYVVIDEVAYSGASFALDGTPTNGSNNSCTSCAAPTLTLTGSNDAIFQSYVSGPTASAVSSPYTTVVTLPQNTDMATSLNTASGTGPTWTLSSTGAIAFNALAIKGTASGVGADEEDIQGVISGSIKNSQPTLASSANWIDAIVAWKAQLTSPVSNNPVITITPDNSAGSGTVTSNVGTPALNCAITAGTTSGVCSTTVASGTSVQLHAVPSSSPASTFITWSGVAGCSTNAFCTISSVTTNLTISADFTLNANTFTVNSQPPATWNPYSGNANSIFFKPLPADVMSHLATNSANMVTCLYSGSNCSNTNVNIVQWNTPSTDGGGASQDQNPPLYYALPSDPWYKIPTGFCSNSPQVNVVFHAPVGAEMSGGSPSTANDQQINIWDQPQGLMIEWGGEYGKRVILGAGGTPSSPASLPVSSASSCNVRRVNDPNGNSPSGTVDLDFIDNTSGQFPVYSTYTSPQTGLTYTIGGTPIDPGPNAAESGVVRAAEIMQNSINHALTFTFACGNGTHVFPSTSVAATCSSTTNAPPSGSLVFCDYTPAQITGMNLPAWKSAILSALCTYGGYLAVTNGQGGGLGLSLFNRSFESGQAYSVANNLNFNADPVFNWLAGQGVPCDNGAAAGGGSACKYIMYSGANGSSGNMFADLPTVGGTGFTSHLHVADPCIAKGYAGLSGGCF